MGVGTRTPDGQKGTGWGAPRMKQAVGHPAPVRAGALRGPFDNTLCSSAPLFPRQVRLPPGPHQPSCSSSTLSHKPIVKTFNNGSLGSGIDEERSEMR